MPPEAPAAAAPAPAPAAAAPNAPAAVAAPAATPPAAGAVPDGNIVANATTPPPTAEAMRAALVEKGAKAEDLTALDDAALKAKYDESQKPVADKGVVKPEDFVVKAPEGVEVDQEQVGKLQGILADAKLSPPERAQALYDLHAAALKQAVEAPVNLFMKLQSDWQAQVKADPEIGGAKLEQATANIAKAIDAVAGSPEAAAKMREAFVFTGAGNHPEIVRLMARMSAAFVEGGAISGGPASALTADASNEQVLTALYPSASKPR
jgi:hypothetical protein